jgi:O-antigen biosynthesis protein WbqP
VIKRGFDLTFSLFYFVFIGSWLMPLIAIGIKLTSKGPVFFRQIRWGVANEQIVCYKFRTMTISSRDIDDEGNYNQATPSDPRITRLGKYLRKTSLDELPQLYSIFVGYMSFVGPRPALFNQDDLIELRTLAGVHALTPGLTGWAQVNGRDELPIPDKVELDKEYLQKQSWFFDLQILLLTFVKVVRREGVVH